MYFRVSDFLKTLSLGQYTSKLYFGNKQAAYSSACGGFCSLLLTLLITSLSIYVFYSTFNQTEQQFNIAYKSIYNKQDDLFDRLTLDNFWGSLTD